MFASVFGQHLISHSAELLACSLTHKTAHSLHVVVQACHSRAASSGRHQVVEAAQEVLQRARGAPDFKQPSRYSGGLSGGPLI
jgi:hypothetical protein